MIRITTKITKRKTFRFMLSTEPIRRKTLMSDISPLSRFLYNLTIFVSHFAFLCDFYP